MRGVRFTKIFIFHLLFLLLYPVPFPIMLSLELLTSFFSEHFFFFSWSFPYSLVRSVSMPPLPKTTTTERRNEFMEKATKKKKVFAIRFGCAPLSLSVSHIDGACHHRFVEGSVHFFFLLADERTEMNFATDARAFKQSGGSVLEIKYAAKSMPIPHKINLWAALNVMPVFPGLSTSQCKCRVAADVTHDLSATKAPSRSFLYAWKVFFFPRRFASDLVVTQKKNNIYIYVLRNSSRVAVINYNFMATVLAQAFQMNVVLGLRNAHKHSQWKWTRQHTMKQYFRLPPLFGGGRIKLWF